jgi:DNA-binding response OmpR family regulator
MVCCALWRRPPLTEKKKLLIADDDESLHRLYGDSFSEEFEVLHALDGADALMLAAQHLPDVILLDITMPLLDGRTICKKIKGNPRTKDIKVIMVTGKGEQHDRLLGFELGADDYVEKPATLAYITRVIRKLGN